MVLMQHDRVVRAISSSLSLDYYYYDVRGHLSLHFSKSAFLQTAIVVVVVPALAQAKMASKMP